jgi:glycosyltransferase involved in cell wall biosynthesis
MNNVVILVPAYQCEATIADTLTSLQSQGKALERVRAVIVADDASRDRTSEIALDSWKVQTPLQVLRSVRNRGEYVNVNEAVAQFPPEVEWFLIMHGDNLAKEHWLETLLEAIENAADRVGTICTSWDDFRVDGRVKPGENDLCGGSRIIPGDADSVRGTLNQGCWWHISSCAIRISTYRAIGGLPPGLRLKGDWDFMLRLLAAGWSIEYIPRALMLYRENPAGSSSMTFRLHEDIKETLQVIRWHRGSLRTRDVFSLHRLQLWFLVRRSVASVFRFDPHRLVHVLPASLGVLHSLASCLWRHREPRESFIA